MGIVVFEVQKLRICRRTMQRCSVADSQGDGGKAAALDDGCVQMTDGTFDLARSKSAGFAERTKAWPTEEPAGEVPAATTTRTGRGRCGHSRVQKNEKAGAI